MNLIKSTGTFSFYTIISRLLGYLRDVLIALFLGAGPVADAFFVAFRIPNTFRRLFAEGTFNAAFVPSYASEVANGKESSDHFANKIFNLVFDALAMRSLLYDHDIYFGIVFRLHGIGFEGCLRRFQRGAVICETLIPLPAHR